MRAAIVLMAALGALATARIAAAADPELSAYAGPLKSADGGNRTSAWALEYREGLSEHLAASFSWLNEGHLPFHHRDGQALQLWWRSAPGGRGLVFQAGVGPYRAYDGTWLEYGYYPIEEHRWGALASAEVDWYFDRHGLAYLRFNHVIAINEFDSNAVVAGVGWHFGDQAGDSGVRLDPRTGDSPWEADVFYGTRLPNSHPTPHDPSESYGVRRRLNGWSAVSVYALEVGGQPFDWHHGVALQGWLERTLTPAFSVGAGLGLLVTKIPPTPPGYDQNNRGLVLNNSSLPFLVTAVTASYAFSSRWTARAVWDRVSGGFSDADIYLLGAGYSF